MASFFDWVGEVQAGYSATFPTSLQVSIGTSVNSYFIGGHHVHCFGPNLTLVANPFELLRIARGASGSVLGGVLGGASGNSLFVYGLNLTANYGGPIVKIQRGPTVSKVSGNELPLPGEAGRGAPDQADPDALDTGTAIAIGVLSTLLVGVTAALELTLHFKYTDGHDPGLTAEVLEGLAVNLPPRLMSMIQHVETMGSFAGMAGQFLKDGASLTNYPLAVWPVVAPIWVPIYGAVSLYRYVKAKWGAEEAFEPPGLED